MNLIYSIVKAITTSLLNFLEKLSRNETTATNAETPQNVADNVRDDLAERVRKQSSVR